MSPMPASAPAIPQRPARIPPANPRFRRLALAADGFFLLRPVLLGPVWTIYAAGALAAGGYPGIDLVFVSLLVGGIYVHNQLADIESDRANEKLFLLAHGHISCRVAWGIAIGSWVVALAWAAFGGVWRLALYAAALLLGVAYNGLGALPYRPWKARPWPGLIANALAHGPVTWLAGALAAGGSAAIIDVRSSARAVPYALAVAAVYLATTVVDAAGDRASGKRTWAVRYGAWAASRLILALIITSAAGAWVAGDLWMAAASIAALGGATLLACEPKPANAEATAKIAVTALALAVALRWPILFLVAGITFLAARIYHRLRFGMRYPSFGPTRE